MEASAASCTILQTDKRMLDTAAKIWNSPVLMTWAAFIPRLLVFLILLPLVISILPQEEAVNWFLVGTLYTLFSTFFFGINATVMRYFSYASSDSFQQDKKGLVLDGITDVDIKVLYQRFFLLYLLFSLSVTLLAVVVSVFVLESPVSRVDNQTALWMAWCFLAVSFFLFSMSGVARAYLEGTGNLALARRIEFFTGTLQVISSAWILVYNSNLVFLLVNMGSWFCIHALWLFKASLKDSGSVSSYTSIKAEVLAGVKSVWKSSWRSTIGAVMGIGLIQMSAVYFAQFPGSGDYLLAIRVFGILSLLAAAPFYSRIPEMNARYARSDWTGLAGYASQRISISIYLFVLLAGCLILLGDILLPMVTRGDNFINDILWVLCIPAFALERLSAMQVQLYSTSDHIDWHKVNGVTALIVVTITIALLSKLNFLSFPIAMIAGYGFYLFPASLIRMKEHLNMEVVRYVKKTVLPMLITIFGCAFFLWLMVTYE